MLISKVESHISDSCSQCTGWFLLSVLKAFWHSKGEVWGVLYIIMLKVKIESR